jgi:hypothetical protein
MVTAPIIHLPCPFPAGLRIPLESSITPLRASPSQEQQNNPPRHSQLLTSPSIMLQKEHLLYMLKNAEADLKRDQSASQAVCAVLQLAKEQIHKILSVQSELRILQNEESQLYERYRAREEGHLKSLESIESDCRTHAIKFEQEKAALSKQIETHENRLTEIYGGGTELGMLKSQWLRKKEVAELQYDMKLLELKNSVDYCLKRLQQARESAKNTLENQRTIIEFENAADIAIREHLNFQSNTPSSPHLLNSISEAKEKILQIERDLQIRSSLSNDWDHCLAKAKLYHQKLSDKKELINQELDRTKIECDKAILEHKCKVAEKEAALVSFKISIESLRALH